MVAKKITWLLGLFLTAFSLACGSDEQQTLQASRETRTISYNNYTFDVVIDKPAQTEADVLLVFHGTVQSDNSILQAASYTLDKFKSILSRTDMMIISVAYPQENVLLGDSVPLCEAALLWVKNQASTALNITVKKVFLAGHSQGGYVVTRLNTMQPTNGVIANAPGPLNLVYRCSLEENGLTPASYVCDALQVAYGSTEENPEAYFARSLLNFTGQFKADILFVQGLDDAPIQMYSWPIFKENIENCTTCQSSSFVEVPGAGHESLFYSTTAQNAYNTFINSH